MLEICESENCDEVLYEVILDRSLNKKHDCNDVIINSMNVNCANNMQNPKLRDASFAISTTCCNDHDWGDSSYDIENLFKPHDEYEIDNNVCNNIVGVLSGVPRLACLWPTAWLCERARMAHLHQQAFETLAMGQASRGGRYKTSLGAASPGWLARGG